VPLVFVSTEVGRFAPAIDFVARLAAAVDVDQSPLDGEDPRFRNWYAHDCRDAIARADAFVALATYGYDGSSWMAHELQTAWQLFEAHGRPRLFIAKPTPAPLALFFRRFEANATTLVGSIDELAAALLAAL
jgi:hypothetical protein